MPGASPLTDSPGHGLWAPTGLAMTPNLLLLVKQNLSNGDLTCAQVASYTDGLFSYSYYF